MNCAPTLLFGEEAGDDVSVPVDPPAGWVVQPNAAIPSRKPAAKRERAFILPPPDPCDASATIVDWVSEANVRATIG